VEVRKPGFQLSKTSVTVEPSRTSRHDVKLAIGSVAESLEVLGDRPAAAVQARPAANGTPQRIQVGGNVQATRIVKMVRPKYPEEMKAQGVEGDVLMEAVISKEGKLLNVKSLNTIVNQELVTAAIEAVKQWEYQPTLLNGQPVEVVTQIHIGFHLK
jgi:protein TonB